MNCAAKPLSEPALIGRAIMRYALCACICALIGCTSTIAPKLASSSQASFDQGGQNSGILAELEDRSLLVTPHLRDRYNALVGLYGAAFRPALSIDQGITPTPTNAFVMAPEAFEHFAAMNRWRKQSLPPWGAVAPAK
jgi:hypothetical protein